MGRIKTSFRHLFHVDHRAIKQLVNTKLSVDDVDFLNRQLLEDNWRSTMPRSFAELARLATSWLRDTLERHTTAIADVISETQVQSAQEVSKTTVEIGFEDRRKERLDVLRREINQGELDRRPR